MPIRAHLLRWRLRPTLRRMRHASQSGLSRRLASAPFSTACWTRATRQLERLDYFRWPRSRVDGLVPLLDLAVCANDDADPLGALRRIDIRAVGGSDRAV